MKLIEVLRLFQTIRISALPVVDNNKRVCDVYAKFDIMVSIGFRFESVLLNMQLTWLISCFSFYLNLLA
jgi:hypothetical protein